MGLVGRVVPDQKYKICGPSEIWIKLKFVLVFVHICARRWTGRASKYLPIPSLIRLLGPNSLVVLLRPHKWVGLDKSQFDPIRTLEGRECENIHTSPLAMRLK